MKDTLKKRKVWTGTIALAALAGAVLFLGWHSFSSGAWGQNEPIVINPQLATDFTNDRKLFGFFDTVFFGKVTSEGTYSEVYPYRTITYSVEALESLRGDVSGTVKVNQPADVTEDGNPIHIQHAGPQLVNGNSYLFVGSRDDTHNWYIVHSTYQQLGVSAANGATNEEILQSEDANQLRERFQDASNNKIDFDPSRG